MYNSELTLLAFSTATKPPNFLVLGFWFSLTSKHQRTRGAWGSALLLSQKQGKILLRSYRQEATTENYKS